MSLLTVEEAKKIGIRACVDKIGYEFCKAHPDNGVSAYGEEREGYINCFVGVSDQPAPVCDISKVDELILIHENDWPYFACYDVCLNDGSIIFLEAKIPE